MRLAGSGVKVAAPLGAAAQLKCETPPVSLGLHVGKPKR